MRLRATVLGVAGILAVLLCLWGVVPLAGRAAQGSSGAAVAEAVFSFVLYGSILLATLGLGAVARVPWTFPDMVALGRFGRGGAIGVAALLLAIGYCALAGTVTSGQGTSGQGGRGGAALPLGLLVVACQVLAEEAMFRGYVQPLLVRGLGPVAGVAVTAISFAMLHAVAGEVDALSVGNMLLGGIWFGLLALRGGGIAAAFGAHLAWNATEQLGLGLDPNPGVGAFGSIVDLDLSGAAAWGGSPAGLNGSVAMAIALAATIAFLGRGKPA